MGSKNNIFVPFLDNLIRFNCRICGSDCCKNGLMTVTTPEKKILYKQNSSLRYFFVERIKKLHIFNKYQACVFLTGRRVCSIERNHGLARKPFLCRTHPFYVSRCQDEYVVIPVGCDMLSAAGEDSAALSQKEILKNAAESIRHGFFPVKINWIKERLDLEKVVLKDSKRFLDHSNYLDFAAHQLSLVKRWGGMKKAQSELTDSLKLWSEFLQVKVNLNNRMRSRELTSFTSLLRTGSPQLNQMNASHVPLALSALYFYALLLFQSRKRGAFVGSYFGITRDMALGLTLLKSQDLGLKRKPAEYKMTFLRALQKACFRNSTEFK